MQGDVMKLPEMLKVVKAADAIGMLVVPLQQGTLNPEYVPHDKPGTIELAVIRDNPTRVIIAGRRKVFGHATTVDANGNVHELNATYRIFDGQKEVAVIGPFPG